MTKALIVPIYLTERQSHIFCTRSYCVQWFSQASLTSVVKPIIMMTSIMRKSSALHLTYSHTTHKVILTFLCVECAKISLHQVLGPWQKDPFWNGAERKLFYWQMKRKVFNWHTHATPVQASPYDRYEPVVRNWVVCRDMWIPSGCGVCILESICMYLM